MRAFASFAARSICLSLASSLPILIFSAIDPSNKTGSWLTTPMCFRSQSTFKSLISVPSIVTWKYQYNIICIADGKYVYTIKKWFNVFNYTLSVSVLMNIQTNLYCTKCCPDFLVFKSVIYCRSCSVVNCCFVCSVLLCYVLFCYVLSYLL